MTRELVIVRASIEVSASRWRGFWMPMREYLRFKSSNISEIREFMEAPANGGLASIEPRGAMPNAEVRIHRVDGPSTALVCIATGYPGRIEFAPVDYHRFIFVVEGRTNFSARGHTVELDPLSPGCLMPAQCPAVATDGGVCKLFSLRVDAVALEQRMTLLAGRDLSRPIELEQIDQTSRTFADFVRQPVLNAARELGHVGPVVRTAYLREFEALMLTRLLLYTKHNYSSLLRAEPAQTSPDRIRRVQDYIHENWNKPLTSVDLETVAEVSGRTLYSDFRSRYGVTPSQYIKRVRLDNARAMLIADGSTSVLEVALHCGFLSFGHFAAAYREMFGELPSETARRG